MLIEARAAVEGISVISALTCTPDGVRNVFVVGEL
jgi:hypothetical protein